MTISSSSSLTVLHEVSKASVLADSPLSSPVPNLNLVEAIDLYQTVGTRNGEFLFNWLHNIYSKVHLPCVDPDYIDVLALDKTKMAIFDVLADDLADNFATRNGMILDEFLQIPWHSSSITSKYTEVGSKLWNDCMGSVRDYPRFHDFKDMFFFDLRQVVSGMQYSLLANTMRMDNSIEDRIHLSHGCMVTLHCDLDLMCSPNFNMADLSNMRIIFNLAQRVAHIGNLLNTYPREVLEKDLSSPLISLAIRKGIVQREEMGDESVLPRLKHLEGIYKAEAKECIRKVEKFEALIGSVNMKGFAEGLSAVLEGFIARPQYWKLNHSVTKSLAI